MSLYVDDLVTSTPDVHSAYQLYLDSWKVMAACGINLRKWHSNSLELLHKIESYSQWALVLIPGRWLHVNQQDSNIIVKSIDQSLNSYESMAQSRVQSRGFINTPLYSIKYQVYCMKNTLQWLVNTVLILVCNQCSTQPPLIILPTYVDSWHSLNGLTKITVKKSTQHVTKGIIWNHCFS